MKMKVIEEKTIYSGRIFDLKIHQLETSSGRKIKREFVDHPGAVAIIALEQGRLLFVRQYRYSVKEWLLEVPAGTLERDESPAECAKRELEEETGYKAGRIKEIFRAYVAPGYSSELIHFFLAEELQEGSSSPEEDEITQVVWVDPPKALEMVLKGGIRDLKTISAILWLSKQEKARFGY